MVEPKIIFQDENLLVLDKPPGWVVNRVESTKGPIIQDWLDQGSNLACQQAGIEDPAANSEARQRRQRLETAVSGDFLERSGIVHRLDKETSGLLLVAKTPASFAKLTLQFADRKVKKKYLALSHGKLEEEGLIDQPVGRLPWNRERFGVFPEGKASKTNYKVLSTFRLSADLIGRLTRSTKKKNLQVGEVFSFLDIQPETGRTHQIRVHLKSLGHPLVSDQFYAGRKTARIDRLWCPRLFLHAQFLGFFHPVSDQWIEFTLELPEDLQRVLDSLVKDTSEV